MTSTSSPAPSAPLSSPGSADITAVTTRLPAATTVVRARPGAEGFTIDPSCARPLPQAEPLAAVAPLVDAAPVLRDASPPVAAIPAPRSDSDAPVPAAERPREAQLPPPGGAHFEVRAFAPPPIAKFPSRGHVSVAALMDDTAPAVEPEPLPAEPLPTEPGTVPPQPGEPGTVPPTAPISPAPGSPVPPAPISPAPGSPVPPAPISPAPGSPASVPPAPVSPAPGAPGLAPEALPDGEALGAEIAAELAAQLAAQRPPAAQPAPRRPGAHEWRGVVLITGTDTDVGKTVVTAAVAAAAQSSGLRVAVIKPGQTGTVTGAPTDIDVVNRLAAPDTTRTLAEYPEPMAPLAAATVASMPPLELYEVVDAIRAEAEKHDLVLIEGAGGLLVPMGVRPSGEAWTVADLATTLGSSTIVVARAGLGTLNHTALTLEALARRGVPAGVVIGAWPADPELVHWANLSELVPHLLGALPDGAGRMDPGVFRRSAPGWLTPSLYGVLDNWRVWAEETGEGHH